MKAILCTLFVALLVQQYSCQNTCKCQNGGICITKNGGGIFCSCRNTGYVGENCTVADPCASNPCMNGGKCASNETAYSCYCPRGFTGVNCESAIDYCNPNPCQNGAACTKIGNFDYMCNCNPCNSDYIGRNCEIRNYCRSQPCQNGGRCQNTNSSYTCDCPPGFNGTNCENQINYCSTNPCQNGGTCQNGGKYLYTCVCAAGFTGPNCNYKDYCFPNPCKNTAECKNRANGYQCECPVYFTGVNCTNLINYCQYRQYAPSCISPKTCQSCYANPSASCANRVAICA